jgi:alpha-N-acetylgalactosaminidase
MFFFFACAFSLDNGLALTPPMGWMAWEQFHCRVDCVAEPTTCISEQLFVDMIDHIAADGWLEAGYNYVNIDDCWSAKAGRDSNNELIADPDRFPHGIAWLADYAHKKGVKLGIYNDYGTTTCQGYPGSEGHLYQDAQTFARWEVDMLKMDGCHSPGVLDMADAYPAMAKFLNSTGRPIMYSCSWPAYNQKMDYAPLPGSCNLWRNYNDISCHWARIELILDHWGNNSNWVDFAGPGHWNDPDQLMIGMQSNSWVANITVPEARTHMGLWAILASPLIMSNDLRKVPDWAREILLNKEIIAVDQDPMGVQGKRITAWGNDATVWARPLKDGDWAVGLWNRGSSAKNIQLMFSSFTTGTSFAVRDLWSHKDLGTFRSSYLASGIEAHDTVMLRLTPA